MSMIKRDETPAHPTTGGNGAAHGASDLLLGAGAEFEGKLTFRGTVRIDAQLKGSITTNDVLVVGENARIDAEITCGTIVVEGQVNGNVKAKTAVEVRRSGRIRGDVETPSILVEKGAFLQGEVRMGGGAKAEKSAATK